MPAIVQLDLSQVLTSADELICRWIELPTSVRTIAAFENLLRGSSWAVSWAVAAYGSSEPEAL